VQSKKSESFVEDRHGDHARPSVTRPELRTDLADGVRPHVQHAGDGEPEQET
jgi:hypothetical protein